MDYSQAIEKFVGIINRYEINMHSMLITENGNTIFEKYVEPFGAEKPHRMYSVTKSFVSAAIGCLIDEGKLKLDDRIVTFFPDKLPKAVSRELNEQTIRNMLMMNTCYAGLDWFKPGITDRCKAYFAQTPVRPAGTIFNYDSTGSYILGCLVERLSGMKLLDYMKLKFLNEIGGFENAHILSTPDGTPWADSALLCTTRALERFMRLVMQQGEWNGKQLISREYMKDAVSPLTETSESGAMAFYNTLGYGYQIWCTQQGGFAFHGMGGQFAVCIPDKKLIFCCTGDNQNNKLAGEVIFDALFYSFCPKANSEKALPEKLSVAHGEAYSEFEKEIDGVWFKALPNNMGIKRFRLSFNGVKSCLEYENGQGMKTMHFGMKENAFAKFPQKGYSDEYGNVHDENSEFMYDCAVSAGWIEKQKLQLRIQVIDRYFGIDIMTIGFRDKDSCGILMTKSAEDFLREYNGWMCAYREN